MADSILFGAVIEKVLDEFRAHRLAFLSEGE
jgi:hypothetical protein